MRTRLEVLLLTAVPLFTGVALADTAFTSMNVSATAIDGASCGITASDMNFGATDGSTRTNATSSVIVDCPPDVQFLVSFDAGLHYSPDVGTRQVANSSNQPIAYFLADETATFPLGDDCLANTYPAGICVPGISSGDPVPIGVVGILTADDELDSNIYTPGTTYSDSVRVEVEF